MAFFAHKSIWDSTVSYWSPSVASFVAFLCVCMCSHTSLVPRLPSHAWKSKGGEPGDEAMATLPAYCCLPK